MICTSCVSPMLVIQNASITPVGGWGWADPQTGFAYNLDYGTGERGLSQLMEHVRRYRADNMLAAIDPQELRRLIEGEICKRPGMESRCCDATQAKRTLQQTISGGLAAAKAVIGTFIPGEHEMNMVSSKLAERRADVCKKCPMNNPPTDQSALEQLEDKAMLKLVGSRKTSVSDELFSCGVCTCNVRAKVWFGRRLINGSLNNETKRRLAEVTIGRDGKPMVCWQLAEPQPK